MRVYSAGHGNVHSAHCPVQKNCEESVCGTNRALLYLMVCLCMSYMLLANNDVGSELSTAFVIECMCSGSVKDHHDIDALKVGEGLVIAVKESGAVTVQRESNDMLSVYTIVSVVHTVLGCFDRLLPGIPEIVGGTRVLDAVSVSAEFHDADAWTRCEHRMHISYEKKAVPDDVPVHSVCITQISKRMLQDKMRQRFLSKKT